MPLYLNPGNVDFDLAHNGMMWLNVTGADRVWTCPGTSSIPAGATYVIHNRHTSNLTIAQDTTPVATTVYYLNAGSAPTSGSVTVEEGGIVTVYKRTDTEWWVWGAKGASTNVFDLEDATNVTVTSIASGEILKWNGSAWINNTLAEAGIATSGHNHTLDSLSNVTITSNSSGEILKWNGSAWINNTLAEAGAARVASNESITGVWTLDAPISGANLGTGGKVKDGLDASQPIGFNVMPVFEQDANDNFDVQHNGMVWHKDGTGTVTYTVVNDSNIPIGATYVVVNENATGSLTIGTGSITLRWFDGSGNPSTGNRTLANGGVATVYKYAASEFWIWGVGIT
jgi:hypothetical protein